MLKRFHWILHVTSFKRYEIEENLLRFQRCTGNNKTLNEEGHAKTDERNDDSRNASSDQSDRDGSAGEMRTRFRYTYWNAHPTQASHKANCSWASTEQLTRLLIFHQVRFIKAFSLPQCSRLFTQDAISRRALLLQRNRPSERPSRKRNLFLQMKKHCDILLKRELIKLVGWLR